MRKMNVMIGSRVIRMPGDESWLPGQHPDNGEVVHQDALYQHWM